MHRLKLLALCVWLAMLASIGIAAWLTHETATFERIGGVWFAASRNFEADYTAAQERVTSTASVRQMTSDERLSLRERVEQMAQLRPTKPWRRLRNLFTILVVGWPVAGIVLVAWPQFRISPRALAEDSSAVAAMPGGTSIA